MSRHDALRMIPGRRLRRIREILSIAEVVFDIVRSGEDLVSFGQIEIQSRNMRIPILRDRSVKPESGCIQQSARRAVARVEIICRITGGGGAQSGDCDRIGSGVRENGGDLRRRDLRNRSRACVAKTNDSLSKRGQRHCSSDGIPSLFTQAFKAVKEKRAIFDDGASDGASEEVPSSYRPLNS